MLRRIKRAVYCGLLDVHLGHIETATFETETERLVLTYMPCSRCGAMATLDLRPFHEVYWHLPDDMEQYR